MAEKQFYNSYILFTCIFITAINVSNASEDWLNHGGNILNRAYADSETKISPQTATTLSLGRRFYAGKDISATPAIYNDTVYFSSWNGNMYAVKASDGSLVSQKNLQELTGLNTTILHSNVSTIVSRATPTIADDKLIVGIRGPAVVIAMERATGNLIRSTRLEDYFSNIITISDTNYNGGADGALVVSVQKSGFAWALYRDNGSLI
ncbi:hypothetical protein LIER_05774 [Lithospermum erythrorhizon]|uniref:Pyrrolo-quinoline quinone repeat domain-containing protein n=1 Tax=Lithospermum erythrorhizon TaxID=34254 RepID=A0AAV3P6N7_LITER